MESYAFEYGFQSLANCVLSEPYYVLVAEGFSKDYHEQFVATVESRRKSIYWTARSILQSLFADYSYLQALASKRVFKVTFLRHLILQRFFGGEAVLSADADIVWRIDPYKLFGQWNGGFFAVAGSGFLTYANTADWFALYRAGLEVRDHRWRTDGRLQGREVKDHTRCA